MMLYWTLFLLVFVPWLIFRATPDSSVWWRFGRLFLSLMLLHPIGLGIFFLSCQIDFPSGEDPSGTCDLSYGRSGLVLWATWGFVFSTCYILFWEFMWRIKHRSRMHSIWRGMRDDLATYICQWLTLIFCAPPALYFTVGFIGLIIHSLIFM